MITFAQLGKYGRLGNQLFQYAALKSLGIKNGYEVPEETKEYHSKSYEKLREPTTILKIQV